jgi:hypothetical protein
MKSEIDAIVDDLLSRWHRWRRREPVATGYAGVCAMFRDTPSPWSAYDRENDAEDTAEEAIMQGVEAAVLRIGNPWRLCLQFEARNLAAGASVWSSPHLPTGEALAVCKIEARTQLIRELHRDGLVGV